MTNPAPIRFYHLLDTPLPRALGDLALKALSQNHRILVTAPTADQVKTLDEGLWTFRQDAFLPHGRDGDPDPSLTPLWVTTDPTNNPNTADTLILTHGASLPDESSFALICDVFDGNDEAQLQAARARWKTAKDAGRNVTYFQQNAAGGWEQKA